MKKILFILIILLLGLIIFANDIFVSSYFTSNITGLEFSPDNSVAVLNNKNDIRIFDYTSFEMQRYIETDNNSTASDWSSDRKFFIVGDSEGKVNVFNLENDFFSFDIEYATESIVDIDIYENMVAFISLNRDVYIYNITKRKLIFKYSMENLPTALFFEGDFLYVGDNKGNLLTIDYVDYELKKNSPSTAPVKDILVIDKETFVFTLDGKISIYNETRLINRIITGNPINKVIKSPDNDYFTIHFSNNDLIVYNVSTMFKTLTLRETDFKIIDVTWTNEWDNLLVTDGTDIYKVNITNGIFKKIFENKGSVPNKVFWKGEKIIYSDTSSNIGFINASNGRIEKIYNINYKFNDFYLDDQNILYTVDNEGFLKVFDIDNNDLIATKKISDTSLTEIDISNDERYISVGGWDYNVYLLDKDSLNTIKVFKDTHRNWIKSIKFNEFSTMLAVSGLDKNVSVTNLNNLDNLNVLNNFNYNIWSIDWSKNSNYILVGGFEGVLEIWDTVFNSLQNRSNISTSPINIVSWSPDSSIILSGTNDGNIYSWRPEDLTLKSSLKRSDNEIIDIAWNDNSRFFTSIDDSNFIRIWDLQEGKVLSSFMIFSDGRYLSFKDNGDYITNIPDNETEKYYIRKSPLSLFETLNYKKVDRLTLQENNPPVINSVNKFIYDKNNKGININVTDNKEIMNVRINNEIYNINENFVNINYNIDIEKLEDNSITIVAIDDAGNSVKKDIEISFENIILTVISNQAPIRDEKGKLLGVISRGIKVQLIGVKGDSYHIKYKDKTGYIQKPFLYNAE
jgi:WD40 repeat protein